MRSGCCIIVAQDGTISAIEALSTVAGSGLFSLISQVFLTYFFIISLKISHFPTISQLFHCYFSFLNNFSLISHLPTMLLVSQLHFPTISQLLLDYFPVKVRIFPLEYVWVL